MLEVAAVTGSGSQPSSRFRVRQHIAALERFDVRVTDIPARIDRFAQLLPPRFERSRLVRWPTRAIMHGIKAGSRLTDYLAASEADVVWLQKEMVPGTPSWEPLFRRPVVFDVDDAIWMIPPAGGLMARTLARSAAVVVAGNQTLASYFSRYARRVETVPTAVDPDRFVPGTGLGDARIRIGWVGTAANLPHLCAIAPALADVVRRDERVRVRIVSNQAPELPGIPPERVEFVPWSVEQEVSAIQAFDIGLMPLSDDPWTRGKCAFKMLQYMACGIPSVVAPVGMNADVLAEGEVGLGARDMAEWRSALETLVSDASLRARMGRAGRWLVQERYAASVVAARLAGILHSVA